jgi:tetratricopeptide (TPR) repeat protein/DNA-binding CsgD family transcriptional regulator
MYSIKITGFLFLFLMSHYAFAQQVDDLLKQSDELLNEDPQKAKDWAFKALEISKKPKDKAEALSYVANAYFFLEQDDSAKIFVEKSILLAREHSFKKRLGRNLSLLGQINLYVGDNNLAQSQLEEAGELLQETADSTGLANVYLRLASVQVNMDKLDEAMLSSMKCYAISKGLNDFKNQAYALNQMSVIHTKIGNIQKGISMANQAIEISKKADLKFIEFQALNNLGILYKNDNQYSEALLAYDRGEELAKELNFERGIMGLAANRGILLNLMGQYVKAKAVLQRALELEKKFNMPVAKADIKINLGNSLYALGEHKKALVEIKDGIALAKQIQSLELQENGHEIASKIYLKIGLLARALEEMTAYQAVHDSIFKLERSKQVEELQTQYETEKKDAEIRDLTQTNELNRWRIWALLLGLIALAAFAYLIVQKRKKDRLLFETEQALEKEKSQQAQVELEYKQKELTAKVLQLAHKNEFLNTVETQLEKLKVNVDSDVSRTGNRISRLIKRDIEGDAQWEQFAQEFTSIHQGFLSRLAEKYGVFSKSEVRLISLLKMNMTSKEIADIMGISDSGVKKARYRLRKKMNLEDSELQGFLLGFA